MAGTAIRVCISEQDQSKIEGNREGGAGGQAEGERRETSKSTEMREKGA